jgi:hypothetical protein
MVRGFLPTITIGEGLVGHPQLVGHLYYTWPGGEVAMSSMSGAGVLPRTLVQTKF